MYAEVLGSLQIYYSNLGDVKTTYDYAKREVAALESNGWGDSEVGVVGHHNLAVVLSDMGERRTAAEEEGIAIQRMRSNAADGLVPASASISYSSMLLKLNRLPEAFEAADDAVRASQRDRYAIAEAFGRQSRAKVEVAYGRLDAATADLAAGKALVKGKEEANGLLVAASTAAESAFLRARGDLPQARALMEPAVEKAAQGQSGWSSQLGYLLMEYCRVALAQSRFNDAESIADKALALFEKRARDPNLSADVGESLLLKAMAQQGLGHAAQAQTTALRALPGLTSGLGPDNPLTLQAAAFR